jgi:hypothetical protein
MKPRQPLEVTPAAALKLFGRAKAIYKELAERLRVEGFSSQADARTVALAASGAALAERLQAEVDALDSLLLEGKPHPLLVELRQQRAQLQSLYGALFMTPRARSASRATEQQFRAAQARSCAPAQERGVSRSSLWLQSPAAPPPPLLRTPSTLSPSAIDLPNCMPLEGSRCFVRR